MLIYIASYDRFHECWNSFILSITHNIIITLLFNLISQLFHFPFIILYIINYFHILFHWNKISIFFQISFTRQLRAILFSSEHFIRPIISRDSRSMVRNGNDRWRAITLSRPSFEVSRVRSVVLSPFTRTTHVGRHLSKYHERRADPIPPRPAKFTRVLGPRRLFAVCETIVGKIRAGTIKKGERDGGKKEGTSNHV